MKTWQKIAVGIVVLLVVYYVYVNYISVPSAITTGNTVNPELPGATGGIEGYSSPPVTYTGPGGTSTSPSIAAFGPGSAPTPTGNLPNGQPSGSIPGTQAAGLPGLSDPNAPGGSSTPQLSNPFGGPEIFGMPGTTYAGIGATNHTTEPVSTAYVAQNLVGQVHPLLNGRH